MNQPGANQLDQASSPYLQQHKDNPVHWRIWGRAALDEARAAHKPILLSIGYAACHWCHVMAHESFEDQAIADIINENFLPIKVDREERPDIDAYYMDALHDLGQQGGWPLTMFLDENAQPIWGGTYFPNPARQGMPGFADVLLGVAKLFRETPEQIAQNRDALKQACETRTKRRRSGSLADDLPLRMARQLAKSFDLEKGGLHGAPKFPNVPMLDFLWRIGLRHGDDDLKKIVITSLDALSLGGIYDHVGGGFARYAVDENWRVPHFEKMLYDNALIIELMTEIWRETRQPIYAQRVEQTIGWLLREMAVADGLAAALDADQTNEQGESQEGAFYAWRAQEIDDLLGAQAGAFKQDYGITQQGNWEDGLSVLHLQKETDQKSALEILFDRRQQRPKPQRDDKVIAHWNGLMITALAHAAWVFDQKAWLASAEKIFAAVKKRLNDKNNKDKNNKLAHSACDGRICQPAFADDYAAMIMAATSLHLATRRPSYLQTAQAWCETFDLDYWSEEGGYFMTPLDADDVPARVCDALDSPWPAANGVIWRAHSRLFALTGNPTHARRGAALAQSFGADVAKNFPRHAGWLCAHDLWYHPMQIVLIGEGEALKMFEEALRNISLPDVVIIKCARGDNVPEGHPAFGKTADDGQSAAFICRGNRCLPKITNEQDFIKQLKKERKYA